MLRWLERWRHYQFARRTLRHWYDSSIRAEDRLLRRLGAVEEAIAEARLSLDRMSAAIETIRRATGDGTAVVEALPAIGAALNGQSPIPPITHLLRAVALLRGELYTLARAQGATFRELVAGVPWVSRPTIAGLIQRAREAPLP